MLRFSYAPEYAPAALLSGVNIHLLVIFTKKRGYLMKLQELIKQAELDINEGQVKAFFLGALTASRPLRFEQACEELLTEDPEALGTLEPELKKLWDSLNNKDSKELENLFPENSDLKVFLATAQERLDYFLTSLSLAGSNSETEDDDLAEILDELEDTVMDIDEYLADGKGSVEDGEELKELLLSTWGDLVEMDK